MIAASVPPTADSGIPVNVLWALAVVGGVLVIGTAFRILNLWREPSEPRRDRLRSQATWWVLYLALVVTVFGGPRTAAILLAVLSLLGVREFSRLTHDAAGAAWTWPTMFVLTIAHYGVLYLGFGDAVRIGTPLVALVLFAVIGIVTGTARRFVSLTATPFLGVMLIVYCPSHAALLAIDAPWTSAAASGTGGFLYLVLLTELHDIAQALWGRALGTRKITPTISPGKTWEGFLLGTATTVCLATVFAPLLVPIRVAGGPLQIAWTLSALLSALGGLVIAVSGFVGDVTMSAIKRDCGVKDSGRLLPGQGGILDRIDSLTLSAPAFYYYALALGRYAGV